MKRQMVYRNYKRITICEGSGCMDINYKAQLLAIDVDLNATLERFRNDEALYEKYLCIFLDDNSFDELKLSMITQDYEEAFKKAHALKGVAANLGLQSIYDEVYPLVEKLRIGDYTDIYDYFLAVEKEYLNVCNVIKSNYVDELMVKCV